MEKPFTFFFFLNSYCQANTVGQANGTHSTTRWHQQAELPGWRQVAEGWRPPLSNEPSRVTAGAALEGSSASARILH